MGLIINKEEENEKLSKLVRTELRRKSESSASPNSDATKETFDDDAATKLFEKIKL